MAKAPQNPVSVLWVEADDEAQTLARPRHSIYALAAYLLLADTVVVHPAYVWQSATTNSLVLQNAGTGLVPGPVKLFLSADAPSVREYMERRIAGAATIQLPVNLLTPESAEYARFGERERSEGQDRLDILFTAENQVVRSGWSRDQEFRRLLLADLRDKGRMGSDLYAILLRDAVPTRTTASLADRLRELAQNPNALVSADSVLASVVLAGNYSSMTLQGMSTRLHVLHWACHAGDDVRVPHVQRVQDPDRIDPYDPTVFWSIMEQMFGAAIPLRVLTLSHVDLLTFTMVLRADSTWKNFRSVYRDIVEFLEETKDASIEEEDVIRALEAALPSRLTVVARQFTKAYLINQIIRSIRLAMGDGVAIPQTLTSAYGLAAGVAKGAGAYNESLRADTKRAIRAAIQRAAPQILIGEG